LTPISATCVRCPEGLAVEGAAMSPVLEDIAGFAGLVAFLAVFVGGILLGIQDMRGPPILPGQPAPLPSWLGTAFIAVGRIIRGACMLIFAVVGVMLGLWFIALITGSWPFAISAAVFLVAAFIAFGR
jgi:hypothetical protein